MIINIDDSKITVLLINYNGTLDTLECVESIECCKTKVGVLIIDNSSRDKSVQIVKKKFPSVEIIYSNDNLGFAGGNNLGFYNLINRDVEFVLILNNDTIIDANMIEELEKSASKSKVVVPQMLYYYDKEKVWYGGGHFNKYTGRAIHDEMNKLRNLNLSKERYVKFATGCCMLIPVDIIRKVGGFNEQYFMYCEDTEFCLRLLISKIDILYNPDAILWHKISSSSGGNESVFSVYYMTRNRIYYLKDYCSMFSHVAILYTVVTRIIKIIIYFFKDRKKSLAIIKGLHDGLIRK